MSVELKTEEITTEENPAVTVDEVTPESDEEEVESHEPKPVFQAIGTLYGQIITEEIPHPYPTEENLTQFAYFIQIGREKYRLYSLRNRYRSWLLQLKNKPDVPLYLRVYPKYQIIPRQPPIISFQVVSWSENSEEDQESGIFIFRGVWQFIPQVRVPVLSIYRNKGAEDPTGKFKAAHLPVLMRREDSANPFKFNPKMKKEDLPPRWFIQGKFKFIPSKQAWGWVEDLAEPTTDIPWYKKPVKAEAEGKDKGDSKDKSEKKPIEKDSKRNVPDSSHKVI